MRAEISKQRYNKSFGRQKSRCSALSTFVAQNHRIFITLPVVVFLCVAFIIYPASVRIGELPTDVGESYPYSNNGADGNVEQEPLRSQQSAILDSIQRRLLVSLLFKEKDHEPRARKNSRTFNQMPGSVAKDLMGLDAADTSEEEPFLVPNPDVDFKPNWKMTDSVKAKVGAAFDKLKASGTEKEKQASYQAFVEAIPEIADELVTDEFVTEMNRALSKGEPTRKRVWRETMESAKNEAQSKKGVWDKPKTKKKWARFQLTSKPFLAAKAITEIVAGGLSGDILAVLSGVISAAEIVAGAPQVLEKLDEHYEEYAKVEERKFSKKQLVGIACWALRFVALGVMLGCPPCAGTAAIISLSLGAVKLTTTAMTTYCLKPPDEEDKMFKRREKVWCSICHTFGAIPCAAHEREQKVAKQFKEMDTLEPGWIEKNPVIFTELIRPEPEPKPEPVSAVRPLLQQSSEKPQTPKTPPKRDLTEGFN